MNSRASKLSASSSGNFFNISKSQLAPKPELQLKLVWPTRKEVAESITLKDYRFTCNYSPEERIQAFRRYLCRLSPPPAWLQSRTGFCAHAKTYCSASREDPETLDYVMMGSHNSTIAAWGSRKKDGSLQLHSVELSVLFTPSLMKKAGEMRWSVERGEWVKAYDFGKGGKEVEVVLTVRPASFARSSSSSTSSAASSTASSNPRGAGHNQVRVYCPLPYVMPPEPYPKTLCEPFTDEFRRVGLEVQAHDRDVA